MADVFEVETREEVGSAATRRLRRKGLVPAVLYGHGEENKHLAVPEAQVRTLLRHHGKMVELKGVCKETALVSDIHWDPLGIDVLHMDLIRVNLKEMVAVNVPIHVRGEAVGVREGGMLLENSHEVEIRCPAGAIPENIDLDVSELALGGHLSAGDLVLPEGVELVTPAETVVCHVEEPRKASEEGDEAVAVGGEPEVISKGGDSSEGED
ncbi:50S ribosomal protein L25 [Rubripirellula lacrimiformis]|uniref:Large ribosomal subunit protein bL25 n=1 Tax=Rubripirellula lacrimiformis TaxID=1930273 RepID=A0A517N7L6_9BACT|nr:50S ribosomal protein L25 [Rubripirellula lacrimiformis]QDT03137.1 50S ribosomal protein L25 [Rubripirellula lacrimiformis]